MPQKSRFQKTPPLPSGHIFSFIAPVLLKWGKAEGGKDKDRQTAKNQAQHKYPGPFGRAILAPPFLDSRDWTVPPKCPPLPINIDLSFSTQGAVGLWVAVTDL